MTRPIIFMHIAKTAGTYLNQVFTQAVGEDASVVHAEVRLRDRDEVATALDDGVRFISGHIYLQDWYARLPGWGKNAVFVTALRDPIEHLVSHILWLDHYNDAEFRGEYARLGEATQRLVDRIGVTDLGDIGALDALLTSLSPVGVQLLDNCQSRYFLCGGGSLAGRFEPLTLAACAQLRASVGRFDVVMRQDALKDGIERAAKLTGLPLHHSKQKINTALSGRTIDAQRPMVRAVLSKRTLVDQWLWRHVHEAQAASHPPDCRRTENA